MEAKIMLYDRKAKSLIEEKVLGMGAIKFANENFFGKILNRVIFNKPFFSNLMRLTKISRGSKKAIEGFIKDYSINVDEVEKPLEDFVSFNDFFIRKLKQGARNVEMSANAVVSPADSRLMSYEISKDLVIPVKGVKFTLSELLKNDELAKKYENGRCLIFRLAPVDYHRFCFTDNAVQRKVERVNGVLYSVNPIALAANFRVFQENIREYCVLDTENFGEVVYMEVGAVGVGRIVQNFPNGGVVKRGQEKGYFEFGGSTIVMLYQNDKIVIDEDIVTNSKNGIETIIKYGEKYIVPVPSLFELHCVGFP